MKRILFSIATIGFIGAAAAGITGAFFSDTEISTGNTFTAGSLDLKIDSEQHYNGNVCVKTLGADGSIIYVWKGDNPWPVPGTICDGTWAEADLKDGVHRFFHFMDIKPGDWGENTISLHVYDNDAWGRMKIRWTADKDNSCNDPEIKAELSCSPDGNGELLSGPHPMTFDTWLDEGGIPGFQCGALRVPGIPKCPADPWEGDNIWQRWDVGQTPPSGWSSTIGTDIMPLPEPTIQTEIVAMQLLNGVETPIPGNPKPGDPNLPADSFFDVFFDIDVAMTGMTRQSPISNEPPICPTNNDGHNTNADGTYGLCHGIAFDGRLVGSTTYYIGWAWHLPYEAGNEVQTDSLVGDMMFTAVQWRNNPGKVF